MEDHVAIIGGGMAGLGAAYTLHQKGIPCTIFEPSHKAGGRVTTEQIGDFHVDVGASFVIKNYKAISQLVKKIDMEDELNILARHVTALYRDDKFHTTIIGKPYIRGISYKSMVSVAGLAPDYIKNIFKINSPQCV